MKIVINKCYGGFGLSCKAVMKYAELKGIKLYPKKEHLLTDYYIYYKVPIEQFNKNLCKKKYKDLVFFDTDIPRNDPDLVKVVEELGEEANAYYAILKIVEIPDKVKWTIEKENGIEWIAEKHRIWD